MLQVEAAGGHVINPKPAFLDPTGERYLFLSDGIVLYRDTHHLTATGANLILLPLFREQLTLTGTETAEPKISSKNAHKKAL